MEHDTSAEKHEFRKIQMEKFAIQAVETIEYEIHLYIQEAGEEHRRKPGRSLEVFIEKMMEQWIGIHCYICCVATSRAPRNGRIRKG